MEAVPEPTVRKGPTPEQITAIKVRCPVFHVLSKAPAARGLLPGPCHSAVLVCPRWGHKGPSARAQTLTLRQCTVSRKRAPEKDHA